MTYIKRLMPVLLLAIASIGLFFGWRVFWFLTDDSFIAFRYVSNSILGYGYVWNAAPFHPVEGYTSFLWVVILDAVWRVTDIEPPDAANNISLLFSFLSLLLGSLLWWSLDWSKKLKPLKNWMFLLFLIGVVSNRVFLTWSSSGLETSMFNFFVLVWLCFATKQSAQDMKSAWALSGSAAVITLTRPDGLLFCFATLVIFVIKALHVKQNSILKNIAGILPLFLVVFHLLWRKSFYGEWLPNTYFAKISDPWPESGLRYFGSFILEHTLWIWIIVVLFAVVPRIRNFFLNILTKPVKSAAILPTIISFIGIATVLIHLGYYTIIVGGDHFEYRVFSYLIIPVFVTLFWSLNKLSLGGIKSSILVIGFLLISSIIPWTHYSLSRNFETREETHQMVIRLSENSPIISKWYLVMFDDLQEWLIGHYVCSRHQEHKIANLVWMNSQVPPRSEGVKLKMDNYPVMAFWGGIGGLSWSLPYVNFIDLFGLNDRVIARSPAVSNSTRRMAHDRIAPGGYVDCFKPNVELNPRGGIRVIPRPSPLTSDEITNCETKWWDLIDSK